MVTVSARSLSIELSNTLGVGLTVRRWFLGPLDVGSNPTPPAWPAEAIK